jgi:hypothetical protein
MRWFIWVGGADTVFPAQKVMEKMEGIFTTLGVNSTFKKRWIEPRMIHAIV